MPRQRQTSEGTVLPPWEHSYDLLEGGTLVEVRVAREGGLHVGVNIWASLGAASKSWQRPVKETHERELGSYEEELARPVQRGCNY